MKSRLSFMLIGLIIVSCSGIAQEIVINGEETTRKLNWSDYRDTVDNDSPFWAFTAYSIKRKILGIKEFGDSVTIENLEVTVAFDPKKSWANKNKVTDKLLIHEQGHFDIAILCMGEILTVFKQTRFTTANFRAAIQDIINNCVKKYHEIQLKYDEDTDHSKNIEQQEKWNTFIAEKLK